ncbi:hypothetical protein K9K77_03640 [Candidatus Babeliales bacterium]|nr:hypothetical protein [Candidatus Babeliales bacterium]
MNSLFQILQESRLAKIIASIITIVLLVILIIAGFGILSAFVTIFLIGVIIYFGSLKELAGSVLVVVLLKMFLDDIHALIGIWTNNSKVNDLFVYIGNYSHVKLILMLFLGVFTISFITGSIKICSFKIDNNKEDKKDTEPKPKRTVRGY